MNLNISYIHQALVKKVKDKNIFVSEIEEKLKKELGNQVKIKTNKNYEGSMTLHFDSIASLEDLISRLSKKHTRN
ncbi:hypothetical protein [Lactococcus fujiensis]|uniref:hypothetical protein n=1 Tax=Lactococcus fujiensis TaxID=610251 RepID=UPI000A95E1D1